MEGLTLRLGEDEMTGRKQEDEQGFQKEAEKEYTGQLIHYRNCTLSYLQKGCTFALRTSMRSER